MKEDKKDKKENFLTKFKSLDSDTRNTYFYGILFVFILLVALIMKLTGGFDRKEIIVETPKEEEVKVTAINYKEVFSKINDNYEENIVINKYYLNEYIDIKKESDKELINIKNLDSNKTYLLKNNELYILKNKEYVKTTEKIYKEIDMTFLDKDNLLSLLNENTYNNANYYSIEASKWISLYNEINGTNNVKKVSGEIKVSIISFENNQLSLTIDLTNLYYNLDYDYEKVICDVKFYNIGLIEINE